jgi:hypothetical protein
MYAKSQECYEDILIASVRQKKYPRVEIPDVAAILSKMVNFDTGYFSKATAADKLIKKTVEGIIKNLKD